MTTTAKRKVQELVRNGKLQDAAEVLRQATGESDADPYDHVYLGDLLMRLGETEEALASYQRAIRSYEAIGLYRNAVAVGKKVLRIDPSRPEVHRGLAQLYERDGLASEALPHFLTYLDSFSGEQVPPTEFLETLDEAASLTGARVEVALRLAEHFQRINRARRAAQLLADVAEHAARAGSPEIAADLRHRARELSERAAANEEPAFEIPRDGADSSPRLETGPRYALSEDDPPTIVLDGLRVSEGLAAASPAADEFEPSRGGAFRVEHYPGRAADDAPGPTPDAAPDDDAFAPAARNADAVDLLRSDSFTIASDPPARTGTQFALPGSRADGPDDHPDRHPADEGDPVWEIQPDSVEPLDLRPVEGNEYGTADDDGTADANEGGTADANEDGTADANEGGITGAREDGSTPFDSEEVAAKAEIAFRSGSYAEARRLFEALPQERIESHEVLSKLVEAVRHLGDPIGEAMYLCRLGDAWIAHNEYESALDCFLNVLALDPKNVSAQRRLARFRELGVHGADGIRESDAHALPGILETGRTEVSVKGSKEFRSEDWVELSGLLEEFKSGLKNQMDASDHQAHYDLAVSHHSMGLLDEALEEIEIALASPALPPVLERRARELKGSCLMELRRFREAVHEYREAADRAGGDRPAQRAALYNLGRALESVEEWQEATETYLRLQVQAPGFLDLEERIRVCELHLTQGGDVSGLSAA